MANMISPVLKDGLLQKQLEENGFIKVPFWNADTVAMVRQRYESDYGLQHKSPKLFHTTYETADAGLIDSVNDFLKPLFLDAASRYLNNMSGVSASYLVKETGPASASPLHQDASFVDEPNHWSVSVWVALEDTGLGNGCLQFIPGSHKLATAVRAIPYSNQHIEPFANELEPYLTQHSIKAGEAFIFLNALIHASPPNTSGKDRLAAVMCFCHSTAVLSLYMQNMDTNAIERYAITPKQLGEINATFKPGPQQLLSSQPPSRPLQADDVKNFIRTNFSPLTRAKVFMTRLSLNIATKTQRLKGEK